MALTKKRAFRVVTVLAVTAATALATACSSGSSKSSSSSSKSAPKSTTLAVAFPAFTNSVDDAVSDGAQHDYLQIAFEGYLLKYKDLSAGSTTLGGPGDVAPDLVTSYRVTPQGIDMTLRPAKSQYGNMLTAQDVQWSMQRGIALSAIEGSVLSSEAGIDSKNPVTIISPTEVRINALPTGLTPNAIGFLAQQIPIAILDYTEAKPHTSASDPWAKTWLTTNSASFGPYEVAAFQPSHQVTLAANPNFYGSPPAYNKVIVTDGSNSSLTVEQLKSGQLQAATGVPSSLGRTLTNDKSVKVVSNPSLNTDMLVLDKTFAPFTNANVRQAVSLALDRDALVKGPYRGFSAPANAPAAAAASGRAKLTPLTYNLSAAKAALAGTKYASGFTITVGFFSGYAGNTDANSLLTFLKSQLSQIGITVNAAVVSAGPDYLAALKAHKYQAYFSSWQPAVPDVLTSLQFFATPAGIANFQGDNFPAFTAALAKAVAAPLGDTRNSLMNDALTTFMSDMQDVPLVDTKLTYIYGSSVCGQTPNTAQSFLPATLTPC